MNQQTESLLKIFKDIENLDAEKEAWQKMFNLQSNLVVALERDKIRLEKKIENLEKNLQLYKDIIRLSDHLEKEKAKEK